MLKNRLKMERTQKKKQNYVKINYESKWHSFLALESTNNNEMKINETFVCVSYDLKNITIKLFYSIHLCGNKCEFMIWKARKPSKISVTAIDYFDWISSLNNFSYFVCLCDINWLDERNSIVLNMWTECNFLCVNWCKYEREKIGQTGQTEQQKIRSQSLSNNITYFIVSQSWTFSHWFGHNHDQWSHADTRNSTHKMK